MAHDPFALLAVGLQTRRPELLEAFRKQIESTETFEPDSVKVMARAIVNLAEEVYDLRRTVDSMTEQQGHVYRALGGCQRQLRVAKEIAVRGRKGTLPNHHDAGSIIRKVKEEVDEEWGQQDEEHDSFAGLTWDAPGACSPPLIENQELKILEAVE